MIYDLQQTDDPRDIVHRSVQALVEGDVIGLPSETVYGVVASALCPEAVQRIAAMVAGSPAAPTPAAPALPAGRMALCLRSCEAASDFLVPTSKLARRLIERCFPGPLTLIATCDPSVSAVGMLPESVRILLQRFAAEEADRAEAWPGGRDRIGVEIGLGGEIAFRVSAHRLLSHIHRYLSAPLVWGEFAATDREGNPTAITTAAKLDAHFDVYREAQRADPQPGEPRQGDSRPSDSRPSDSRPGDPGGGDPLPVLLDDGLTRYGGPGTIVRLSGNSWQILREGVIQRAAMNQFVKPVIVIVCTGNTCRSPMAETLLRDLLHKRFGREDVARVLSAGVAAQRGSGASPQSVEVMGRRGLDLTGHCSQPLDDPLMSMADLVLTLTRRHRDAILAAWPDRKDRIFTLRRDGGDVSDPVGMPVDVYEQVADQISEELEKWVDALDDDFFPTAPAHPD